MTRASYNAMRGNWTLPTDEDGNDEGYLVEYLDGGKPNHPDFAGYISWSPKAQFDAAYLEIGDVAGMPPHQQRVVAEKADLNSKMDKLTAFIDTPIFMKLGEAEQERLVLQLMHMGNYTAVLHERIEAFKNA